MTGASDDLRALAQRLADSFPSEVVEVLLTGSVSRGVADELSDIEMLVITEEQISLEEAFALAGAAGLTDTETWGDPATATRRVHGYLDGQSIETIWWFPSLAEERFATGGSAEAIANGVALRGGNLLAGWQERLADYPDALVAERCEQAAERWGGWTPRGILTIVRDDTALARMEWLVESAQRVLQIVYALNRIHQPTAKRLGERLDALAIKPERTAERIEAALAEPDPRRALLTMTELQLDTLRLAPSGPNVDRARVWLEACASVLRDQRPMGTSEIRPRLLLVVTGMPSSGKTTVAEGLARRLRLPLIAKDEIKEGLYDALGADDVDASARLGGAAYALIFALARSMLDSGVSVIVEANFFGDQKGDFASLPACRLVQVHCHAPLAVLSERYASRTRHLGHQDAEKIKELPARFASGAHDALDLPGELIELDTTRSVDLDALAARVFRGHDPAAPERR